MNRAPRSMSALKAGERDVFNIAFPLLSGETFQLPMTFSARTVYGTDADANLCLVEPPQTAEPSASLLLQGRVPGAVYACRLEVSTSFGRRLAEDFIFEVKA